MCTQSHQTRKTYASILAVVAVLVGGGAGHAADVTIGIQAPVVIVTDPAGVLGGTIQAGDVISGTYTALN